MTTTNTVDEWLFHSLAGNGHVGSKHQQKVGRLERQLRVRPRRRAPTRVSRLLAAGKDRPKCDELIPRLHTLIGGIDKTGVRTWLLAVWIVALHVSLFAAFPSPDGYVNDYAAVLTEDDEAYLEDFLKTLEAETSAEVAIVTVSSLEGMTIEEYANRLFAQWGIGRREQDNGVLLLVAPGDRAVRIEVGYGVEAILPDGLAGEIIRSEMLPEFKSGNLRRGIGRGINRISQIVRRDPTVVSPPASNAVPQEDRPPAVFIVPFFGIFTTLGGFVAGLALATRTFGPLLWSGLFVGIPLVIASEMVSVLSLVTLMCLGLCAMLVGRRSGRLPYWQSVLRTGVPGSVTDDEPRSWVMGGADGPSTDSGSSTSHGSSGSDFGGGSSGGGGASGRW